MSNGPSLGVAEASLREEAGSSAPVMQERPGNYRGGQ